MNHEFPKCRKNYYKTSFAFTGAKGVQSFRYKVVSNDQSSDSRVFYTIRRIEISCLLVKSNRIGLLAIT